MKGPMCTKLRTMDKVRVGEDELMVPVQGSYDF